MDLGARPVRVFFDITIPVIAPALIAGWLLAFTLSLDDLVIASFVTGPGASTLPMVIFSKVRLGVSPDVNALATIIIGVVALGRARSPPGSCGGARGVDRAGDSAFRAAGAREHWAGDDLRRRALVPAPPLHPRARRRRRRGHGLSLRRLGHLPPRLPARPRGRSAPPRCSSPSSRPSPGASTCSSRSPSSTAATAMLDPHHPETRGAGDRGRRRRGDRRRARSCSRSAATTSSPGRCCARTPRSYGPLALVQVDAHGDLWPDDPGRHRPRHDDGPGDPRGARRPGAARPRSASAPSTTRRWASRC